MEWSPFEKEVRNLALRSRERIPPQRRKLSLEEGKNPPSRKQKESPYMRKEFLSRRTQSFLREQVRRKESLHTGEKFPKKNEFFL
jgi:hypothetical protein